LIYLLLHIIAWTPSVEDTLQFPERADTVQSELAMPDTLDGREQQNSEEAEDEDEFRRVHVWEFDHRPGFSTQLTDSTLRWVNALNLTQIYSRRPGAITYRTGTIGRPDGLDYHGFTNRDFAVEMGGLRMENPLTGIVNWNRVPIHKIQQVTESDFGPHHRSEIRLKDHYLVKPRTYLNFDESKGNYRNLEFTATHNITQKTNIELSYWDRRDGIRYRRSGLEGSQVVMKAYHQLTDRWMMRSGYITNSMQIEQPFGYQVQDPSLFTFNPFTEIPIETSAESDEGSKDLYLQAHFRADTSSSVKSQVGIHYQTNDRTLEFSRDTVSTDIRNIELFARYRLEHNQSAVTASARSFLLENRTEQLTENNWLGLNGDLDAQTTLLGGVTLSLQGGGMVRNDSGHNLYTGVKAQWQRETDVKLAVFGGYASRSADLQALYWQSATINGDPGLLNEQSVTAGVEASVGLGQYITVGGRGDIRETDNGVFAVLNSENEGNFQNVDPYTTLSASGWIDLNSSIFEGSASATIKTFESSASANPVNQGLQTGGERVWLKGDFYWKNYLFDRATFVKAGIIGLYSPNFMRTADYIAALNRWQHGTGQFLNPPYSRVDIDVSARVRWMMVLLRWENIFDRVNQPGYFETVGYPMPEQRFIFGLRVLFTN